MALNLLQIVQQACNEMGLPSPAIVIGSQDTQTIQMLALVQREGKELSARPDNGGWQILDKEYTFTLAGQTALTGTLTAGSNVVTAMPSTSGITVGQAITGDYILNSTYITAVTSNSVTMTQTATGSGTATNITVGTDQYPFPTDMQYLIPSTAWDRSFRWQLLGPMDAQEWQVLKSGITPTGPRSRFRIKQGKLFIDPVPGAYKDNMVIEYISNQYILAADGVTYKTSFTADTDTPIIPDDLFVLGLIWRYKAAKGLDYSQEQDTYENAVQRFIGRDKAARSLPMNAQRNGSQILSQANVPDTGFGT